MRKMAQGDEEDAVREEEEADWAAVAADEAKTGVIRLLRCLGTSGSSWSTISSSSNPLNGSP